MYMYVRNTGGVTVIVVGIKPINLVQTMDKAVWVSRHPHIQGMHPTLLLQGKLWAKLGSLTLVKEKENSEFKTSCKPKEE